MNPYLEKIAKMDRESKEEFVNTGVGAGLGAISNTFADRVLNGRKSKTGKAALIGGGIGFLSDFTTVKLNKNINKHIKDE